MTRCRDYISFRDVLLNETMPFTTMSIFKILQGDKSLCTCDIFKIMKQYQNISCPLNALPFFKPYACPILTT